MPSCNAVESSSALERVVRHLVPAYEVPHSIIVIAQQWPCWLSTVLSLALPV